MESKIKTASDEWRNRFYISISILIIIGFLFIGYILFTLDEVKELEKQTQETRENAIQIGQNSTINYIIGNKKYPTKFKGNIVWLTKNELCEED